ncbi:MAG TPA: hypothetical protein VJC07_04480 [Candidatus Nanoarchaeia archaeon]|nr:hypothetical protein [Candidatus Nanoarchaeia archaeon]
MIIKQFEDFIKEGIVKQQAPDIPRARFLKTDSEKAYAFLCETTSLFEATAENANTLIKNCYDIIMGLVRAKMALKGLHASGQGAHEAEVAYLRVLNHKEADVQFIDQLRYFRNGIMYYGKQFDKEYAKKVIDFTKSIYKKLE